MIQLCGIQRDNHILHIPLMLELKRCSQNAADSPSTKPQPQRFALPLPAFLLPFVFCSSLFSSPSGLPSPLPKRHKHNRPAPGLWEKTNNSVHNRMANRYWQAIASSYNTAPGVCSKLRKGGNKRRRKPAPQPTTSRHTKSLAFIVVDWIAKHLSTL